MTRPRLFCDFNTEIDEGTYALNSNGTKADLARAGLTLHPGLEVELYDHDEADDGTPVLMLADGIVVEDPEWGFAAQLTSPFRWIAEDA